MYLFKNLYRQFSEEDIQMANRYMKNAQLPNQQRNTEPNHEVSPHTCKDGYYQKTEDNKGWQSCREIVILAHCW